MVKQNLDSSLLGGRELDSGDSKDFLNFKDNSIINKWRTCCTPISAHNLELNGLLNDGGLYLFQNTFLETSKNIRGNVTHYSTT